MPRISTPLVVALALGIAATRLSSLAAEPSGPPAGSEQSPGREQAADKQPGEKPPADKPPGADSPALKGRSPRVLFIVTSDCPRCDESLARLRAPKGDFEKLRSVGWKIGAGAGDHVQIIDRAEVESLVAPLDLKAFPAVVGLENGRVERSFQTGCTTPLDMWTLAWLLKGRNERPAGSLPEQATAATSGHYPLRGNHWTIDGDWQPSRERLVSHLRGPVHGPQIAGKYEIEIWSYEELRSLHDRLHEVEMGGVQFGVGRPATEATNPFSATKKTSGR